jgi:hypothetical protein
MYAIISNTQGELTTCNSQAQATETARYWAGLRKETLYIYFRGKFFASTDPNESDEVN